MRGIFVSFSRYLGNTSGGVQICTKEYIDVIQAAGITLEILPFEIDKRPWSRLKRLLNSSPYTAFAEDNLADRVAVLAQTEKADFIFLNQVTLAVLAGAIRRRVEPPCKIVLLSHGAEITDLLHFVRLRKALPLRHRLCPTPAMALGGTLLTEMEKVDRRSILSARCLLLMLSLKSWLGSARTCWLPRRVISSPLPWNPDRGRLGWVGTLDHAPNLEGLVEFLAALAPHQAPNVRVRVVGSPVETGEWLADRFASVEYVGPLADEELLAEAATWTAFLNPIFCQSRGCSTKLAKALGWHIPVITTSIGRRGYVWRQGGLVQADTPEEFARSCLGVLTPGRAQRAREDVVKAASTSPSTDEIAKLLLFALGNEPLGSSFGEWTDCQIAQLLAGVRSINLFWLDGVFDAREFLLLSR